MITRVSVQNIAIISQLSVDLAPGLTVITGESGSGKSILMESIALAFGLKASPKQVLKAGCQRGLVEVNLRVSQNLDLAGCLSHFEFEADFSEPEWSLSREFTPQSSRFRLNGIPVTRELVEAIRPWFVDIHGQHELHQLFSASQQLLYLDSFGGKEITLLKASVSECYGVWHKARQKRDRLVERLQAATQNRDFLLFQINELDEAGLAEHNEDETIRTELNRLSNASQLIQATQYSYALLQEGIGQNSPSLLDQLGNIQKKLAQAGALNDPVLRDLSERIDLATSELHEIASLFVDYPEQLDSQPERLAELTDRLDVLERLKRKYGPLLSQVIEQHATLTQELSILDDSDFQLEEAEKLLETTEAALKEKCDLLTEARRLCAQTFKAKMQHELQSLAMQGVSFDIELYGAVYTANGADGITFLFSANPGEPLKPLAQVASGGELSRFLLAAKVLQSQSSTGLMSLLFDEIDTGISGPTAQAVAEKMVQLAQQHQIIAITHQPMIATLGDQHLHVKKQIDTSNASGHAVVCVASIAERKEIRQEVLAQMISGSKTNDETTRKFISQLQEQAQSIRKALIKTKNAKATVLKS